MNSSTSNNATFSQESGSNFSSEIGLGVLLTLLIFFLIILSLLCLRLAACCAHIYIYSRLLNCWGRHPR